MPSYTLVGTPFSTFTRTIALALRYKNIPFTQLETKPHEELAKQHHPFGYLPSLVISNGSGDDKYDEGRSDSKDIALRESQAIARYIDRIEPRLSLHDDEGQLPEKMWEFVNFCTSYGTSSETSCAHDSLLTWFGRVSSN
jgi:glutathione S-transferase